jgi:hypothetical protein
MAECRKLVEPKGAGTAYPCDLKLPEGHDGPCASRDLSASIALRKQWLAEEVQRPARDEAAKVKKDREMTAESAKSVEAPGLEHFQTERTIAEAMTEPGSITPVPGQRGFPQDPSPWQVHTDQAGEVWAWAPGTNRWYPAWRALVSEPRLVAMDRPTGRQTVAVLPDTTQEPSAGQERVPGERRTTLDEKVAAREGWKFDMEPPPPGSASRPEPDPVPSEGDVWAEVIADMADRREFGIAKYDTPLQRFNGRDAMTDAYQEALDLVEREIIKVLYARVYFQAIDEFEHTPLEEPLTELARLLGVIGDDG